MCIKNNRNAEKINFLLDGKPNKIKRNIITQDYSVGGVKMIQIDSYINS